MKWKNQKARGNNGTRSQLLEKINKIYKPLARLTKKETENLQLLKLGLKEMTLPTT